ncbi:hypothetical protein EV182_004019 [Spiromyces aspiralis]|uniref:Uncharacterized protein n=1 Tax=Spiromyces aspiralis TaxID=68401 RepID=A0ACC1HQE2_9FUNG|nr:hypothetical protein EV182_004019 [Spiromyces aspiralis]
MAAHKIARTRKSISCLEVPSQPQGEDTSDRESTDVIKVPGELVLAYSLHKYYPAKVIGRASYNRYKIMFLDGCKTTISRRRMFTMFDEGFYTCSLGDFEKLDSDSDSERSAGPDSQKGSSPRPVGMHPRLARLVAEFRPSLERIHQCKPEDYEAMSQVEPLMDRFFKLVGKEGHAADGSGRSGKDDGGDLAMDYSQRGQCTVEEYEHLFRVLMKWFPDPPFLWTLMQKSLWSTTEVSISSQSPHQNEEHGDAGGADLAAEACTSNPPSPARTVSTVVDDDDDGDDDDDKLAIDNTLNDVAVTQCAGSAGKYISMRDTDAGASSQASSAETIAADWQRECLDRAPRSAAASFNRTVLLLHLIKQLVSRADSTTIGEAGRGLVNASDGDLTGGKGKEKGDAGGDGDDDWVDKILTARLSRSMKKP